ncbi:MAG TPA: L,D-transpeptidase family protein [Pseudolabrys sp.]|uniref:L,D-transpeptidase family protein n=1 Tax=Pseudolabrys sp. TaxID=1960880 RepID=UPI002DDD45F1|nr:L,D-transpeptidase family protein [Pseudolabrys sp.]HEV2629465.1 L,D-transpeptidase family protein [Pseudolabrys sp.]
MKCARFNRLLASTALGFVLAIASHPGMAQQAADQQKVDAGVPIPDTSLPPPLTAKDVQSEGKQNAAVTAPPAPATKAEPQPAQNAAAPAPAQNAAAPAQSATAPAAEPAKPAAVAAQAVADRLRELITSRQFDRIVGRKADREGIESYYKHHDYAPIWVANGAADTRAKSAADYLAHADQVGLEPSDYPTPAFKSDMSADQLAEAEIKLTETALTFARQAQTGRVSFTRVGNDISFHPAAPEPAEVLAKLAGTDDAGKVLDAFNPPQPEFKALRAKLAELRSSKGDEPKPDAKPVAPQVRIPEGKILRPGMKDERVIALRKRLDIAGDKNDPRYDDKVMDAVKAFQLSADIGADGMLGPNTVRVLNGQKVAVSKHRSLQNKIDTIVVNMERWRWFPRDLGDVHVIVNVPDFTLTLYNHGSVYWHSKIVAGKPGKATPMISAEMKYITVNPTWNVPPSIIEKEYLPALQEDPQALDRIGLKVEEKPDGTLHIFQPPGAANALGRIRFNFPNKFLVYQHDTPDKYLFARDKRAYSHGCMRVQNPETYATKLLSLVDPDEHYNEARIEKMYGSSEININFKKPVWVHLTYQTAFVDADGNLQFRDDVYGRDAKMLEILKGPERRVADIPVERPPDTSSKPVRVPAGMVISGNGPRYGGGGPNFFDFLFGGGGPSQAPVYRPRGYVGNNGRYYR